MSRIFTFAFRLLPFAFRCLVMQQETAAIGREIEVRESVVVVVTNGTAEKMAFERGDPGSFRNIGKAPLAIPPIECKACAYQQNIQVAVVICIEESTAIADGLQDSKRAFTPHLPAIVQSSLSGAV